MKRPLKPCMECGKLSRATRCENCAPTIQTARNKRHNQQKNPHYATTAWQKAREQAIKAAHGMCELCGTTSSLTVHHLNHIADGTADNLENLMVLCDSHHSQLEAEYQRGHTHGPTHTLVSNILHVRALAHG